MEQKSKTASTTWPDQFELERAKTRIALVIKSKAFCEEYLERLEEVVNGKAELDEVIDEASLYGEDQSHVDRLIGHWAEQRDLLLGNTSKDTIKAAAEKNGVTVEQLELFVVHHKPLHYALESAEINFRNLKRRRTNRTQNVDDALLEIERTNKVKLSAFANFRSELGAEYFNCLEEYVKFGKFAA